MSNKPLVSAIVIFLNEERFIQEAIDSVFAQAYHTWELLLVDDGSTDDSSTIARRYAEQYPEKVRYLEHEDHQNQGMSASRNLGVRKAKGKYLAYLDADDVWLPHKLEQQVALLDSHPEAVMVYGPLLEWRSWSGKIKDHQSDRLYGVGFNGAHPYADSLVQPPELLTLSLRQDDFIPSGVLIRREVVEQLGGFEEDFSSSYEDAVFQVKVCLNYPVYVSSQCWYKYRIHPNSCERIAISLGKARHNRGIYLDWAEKYLSAQGSRDQDLWNALARAKFRCRHEWWYRFFDIRQYLLWFEVVFVKIGRRLLPAQARHWLWGRWQNLKEAVNSQRT